MTTHIDVIFCADISITVGISGDCYGLCGDNYDISLTAGCEFSKWTEASRRRTEDIKMNRLTTGV
jgi:hypothetical protein